MNDDTDDPVSGISPADRDIAVRTIVGEASNQPFVGQRAVANVMLNRLRSGQYGSSLGALAADPSQFNAWMPRFANSTKIATMPQTEPAYQTAAAAFDAARAGAPDPTNGATQYWSPKAAMALGFSPPSFTNSSQPIAHIGDHFFYTPNQTALAYAQAPTHANIPADDALDAFLSGKPMPPTTSAKPAPAQPIATAKQPKQPSNDDWDKFLSGPVAPVATQAPVSGPTAPTLPSDEELDRFLSGGASTPTPAPTTAQSANAAPLGGKQTTPATLADKAATVAQEAPGLSTAASASGGFLNGLPIVGPYALDAGNRIAAAIMSVQNGTPFETEYEKAKAISAANFAAHPTAKTAGSVAGAVAGTIPAVIAAPEAFGIGAGSVGARVAASALTNAGIGGADAAARGGDTTDIARSGLIGAAFGGIGPVGGQAAGALARWGIPGITRGASAAENSLIDAVGGLGPTDLTAMSNRLANNPRLTPMDVSDPLQMRAMGIASQPGQGRTVLNKFVSDRNATAGDAVSSAYDTALGPTPNVMVTLQGMKATAAANAAKGFGEALTGARPVNVMGALRAIDERLTPGVQSVAQPAGFPPSAVDSELLNIRARLAGPDGNSMLTDATKLHELQSSLRQDSETLLNSASGQDRRVGAAVANIRGKIVDAIDDAADGKYKPAQKQYADDMGVQDAFDKGTTILTNKLTGSGLENRPEYWQSWVANAAPSEIDAAKLGARTAVDQRIGSVRNAARTGSTLTDVGLNTDRLETLLGPQETNKLAAAMHDAQAEYTTNNKLFQNSQTAPREEAAKATAVRPITGAGTDLTLPFIGGGLSDFSFGNPYVGAAAGIGIPLMKRGIQYLGQRADLARNLEMANKLSAPGQKGADVIDRLAAIRNARGTTSSVAAPVNLLAQGSGRYLGQPDQPRQPGQ